MNFFKKKGREERKNGKPSWKARFKCFVDSNCNHQFRLPSLSSFVSRHTFAGLAAELSQVQMQLEFGVLHADIYIITMALPDSGIESCLRELRAEGTMIESSYLELKVFVCIVIQDKRTLPTQEVAGKENATCRVSSPLNEHVPPPFPVPPALVSQMPPAEGNLSDSLRKNL